VHISTLSLVWLVLFRTTIATGLTDAAFRMIPLLGAGRNADWPV
jgi:hypothetical protein